MAENAGDDTAPNARARRGTRFTIGGQNDNRGSGADAPTESEAPYAAEFGESVSVNPKRGRKSKADVTAAKGAADMMIGFIESLAYARYRRPEARMTPDERKMALEGLAASVKVLPADVVNQISSLSAPVMCAMGFVLYAARLAEMENAYRANKRDTQLSENVDNILANQQTVEYDPSRHGPVHDNGFYVPPKSALQNLQEI